MNNFSYGISAANILTDVIVLVLPIPWLYGLQMKTSKKVAIGGIFLLGSLYVALLRFSFPNHYLLIIAAVTATKMT